MLRLHLIADPLEAPFTFQERLEYVTTPHGRRHHINQANRRCYIQVQINDRWTNILTCREHNYVR